MAKITHKKGDLILLYDSEYDYCDHGPLVEILKDCDIILLSKRAAKFYKTNSGPITPSGKLAAYLENNGYARKLDYSDICVGSADSSIAPTDRPINPEDVKYSMENQVINLFGSYDPFEGCSCSIEDIIETSKDSSVDKPCFWTNDPK